MQQNVVDLFGEVVITQQDISLWLLHVPRIHPDSPRAVHYVRSWDVAGKVREAKLAGRFESLTTPRLLEPESLEWWHRMCWH